MKNKGTEISVMNNSLEKNSIIVNNISKKYDEFSLENVSFNLPKGCIMGFIGENGAGKSTTIKIILDLVKSDNGNVKVLGDNAKNANIREDIGVVFDENCFPEELNADNLKCSLKHIYKNWDSNVFDNYMNRFSIPCNKSLKDFSRGMKMKLAIAIALSHGARLLVLDEATSGLDPIVREQILDVFMEFIQNEENSILLSSHIISDLEKVCDYITFIHEGKILLSMEKDMLMDEYGLLKCSKQELENIPRSAIERVRENQFGVEALVKRSKISRKFSTDKASLEDIMLFMIRGNKVC